MQHSQEHALGYFGWKVLAGAVIGLALSPGPVALLLIGALSRGMAQQHGWTLGQIMVSLTFLNVGSILAAPFAGQLVDRLGPRAILLPCIAIMAACLLALGYAANTLTELYAISAIYGFATIGAQSLTYTKLLTSWFNVNRGLVLGIAAAGLGLGYTILPLIIVFGMGQFGPAGTTVLLAALLIVLPLALNIFVAYPRPNADEPAAAVTHTLQGATLREAAATPTFWIIAAAIFLISIIATGIVPHFNNIARDAGYHAAEAATIASIFGFATLAGRLIVGYLFDRFFAPRVACTMFALAGIGYGIAACVTTLGLSWPVLASGAILMGLGFGAESDLIGYLASRYFGYRHFGAIYGTLLAIFILGVAVGPLLYGIVRDTAGSYQPILAASAILGIGAGLVMLALPRFPQPAVRQTDAGELAGIGVATRS